MPLFLDMMTVRAPAEQHRLLSESVLRLMSGRSYAMSDLHGYLIKKNPDTGKWEIFWKEKKVAADFAREVDAEEWIEDQVPLYRTS